MTSPQGCVEHVRRLDAVDLTDLGTQTTYTCIRCGAERLVGPDEDHPQTV